MSILHDLAALADKAARITQPAAPCLTRQRLDIQSAAYEGNAEQQAAMKAARHTGDAELIAIEVGLANARVASALQAHDKEQGI